MKSLYFIFAAWRRYAVHSIELRDREVSLLKKRTIERKHRVLNELYMNSKVGDEQIRAAYYTFSNE